MRAFIAMLGDSLRQTADQKVLYVLLLVSASIIMGCFSLGFTRRPVDDIVGDLTAQLGTVKRSFGLHSTTTMRVKLRYDVSNVSSADGKCAFDLLIENRDKLARVVENKRQTDGRRLLGRSGAKRAKRTPDDIADGDLIEYLEWAVRSRGGTGATVVALPAAADDADLARRYHVEFGEEALFRLEGAHEYSLFFGAVGLPMKVGVPVFLTNVLSVIVGTVAGLMGIIIGLIVTASFVPQMLQKGQIDFLLSRPISRGRLLLAKYFGGLFFIVVLAGVLLGGVWLALSIRSGYWSAWPLLTIPVVVYFFAVLYAFSVFMGFTTRSTVAVIFASLLFWGLCGAVGTLHQVKEMGGMDQAPAALATATDAAYAITPRTGDLGAMNQWILAKAYLSKDVQAELPDVLRSTNYVQSLALTTGWIVGLLLLAWWRFRRRDF